MKYENESKARLIRYLRDKDFLIQELEKQYREDSSVRAFNKLALELEEERILRLTIQENNAHLHQALQRYQTLVGDLSP